MKKILFILATALSFLNSSCTDDCTQTRTYKTYLSFQVGQEQLVNSIKNNGPSDIKNPGKIYAYDNYVLISEIKKGIHIIDNTNPTKPLNIGFISIPGILDMAVKDNILYADNYTDLVSIDITNVKNTKVVGRLANRFQSGLADGVSWYIDPNSKIITDFESKIITETVKTNCENGSYGYPQPYYYGGTLAYGDSKSFNGSSGGGGIAGSNVGTGGSSARFTIYKDYLYAATQSDLLVFGIKNGSKPDSVNKINLGWGIETIFPYKDKLFIGSNTGMHIYDNVNPAKPVRLSIFQHARACDPVVVQEDRAYVTLREGWCGVAPNRLDVININNLSFPSLIKSYPMENPQGLSIDKNKLIICEGKFGLKSFDASNDNDIKLLGHVKDINAQDVIQLSDKLLLMIGKDGFYQYDNSDPKNMKLLSKIEVVR